MSNKEKVGSYKFIAEPFHVDFKGKLTFGVLGNHFLNCAGFHAADRGFGISELNEENYTWVLSRLAIEMIDMPNQNEAFTVQTWVENVYRLFTDRNFAVLNQDGEPIGYARSVWAMINMNTRKPVDLLSIHGGNIAGYVDDKECPIEKHSRIKVTSQEMADMSVARYCDIDINGHVNSIRYIEHILNLFPLEFYEVMRVRRFEIAYIAEARYGDELKFYKEEVSPVEYHVEVRRNGEEVICRGKVLFE